MPVSRLGQVNFTEAKEIPQGEPVMAGMFTIDSHPAYNYLILVYHIHS